MSGRLRTVDKLFCGICGAPADLLATVPMCGQRPRYPLCHQHYEDLAWCDYVEDVVPIT